MLTAIVLVCSLLTTPNLRDCDRQTALVSILVPGDFSNPATCFMHGQAFLAETSLPPEKDQAVKIMCVRSTQKENVG